MASKPSSPSPHFPGDAYVHRRVPFRFSRENLQFDLSLGLFSSAGIDAGSRLLLKTVARSIDLDGLRTIRDDGCGVGVLGLSLAKRLPDASVTLTDRDFLAVTFTRRNAALNKVNNVDIREGLLLEDAPDAETDLLLCNFPAKAGDPALEDYLHRARIALRPGGHLALVIVHTLADRCRERIGEAGFTPILEESSKMHTVFHARPSEEAPAREGKKNDGLDPYIRHHGSFRLRRRSYELDTVWNVPDFDIVSWRLTTSWITLEKRRFSGSLLFWSPGQGHIPVAALAGSPGWSAASTGTGSIILAGRDLLQLRISDHNLARNRVDSPRQLLPAAAPELLDKSVPAGSLDLLWIDYAPVSRSNSGDTLPSTAGKLVKPGGIWAVVGRSGDVTSLTKTTKGFTPVADKRYRGWRSVVYRRNED